MTQSSERTKLLKERQRLEKELENLQRKMDALLVIQAGSTETPESEDLARLSETQAASGKLWAGLDCQRSLLQEQIADIDSQLLKFERQEQQQLAQELLKPVEAELNCIEQELVGIGRLLLDAKQSFLTARHEAALQLLQAIRPAAEAHAKLWQRRLELLGQRAELLGQNPPDDSRFPRELWLSSERRDKTVERARLCLDDFSDGGRLLKAMEK